MAVVAFSGVGWSYSVYYYISHVLIYAFRRINNTTYYYTLRHKRCIFDCRNRSSFFIWHMIELQKDEQYLYTFRRHPIVLLPAIIILLVFAALPFFIIPYIPANIILPIAGDPANLFTFLYIAWLTLLWLALSIVFIDHWLDMWIITDKRLLDFEQLGLFNRETAVLRIEQIQDISIEVKGVIPTFLNYGDIHVQTAGANKEFVLHNINNPINAKKILYDVYSKKVDN